MQKFDITDSVAVLNDRCDDVKMGQVGIIVEVFGINSDVYEVEFCDKDGRTLVTCAIEEEDLLKLYF